jgi:hypothetical protein
VRASTHPTALEVALGLIALLGDGHSTDDFKYALAHSLRARGVEVDQKKYPCQKLVPSRQTQVRPVAQ